MVGNIKIAVISDTHLGYRFGSEQGEDAFLHAAEAFEQAIQKGADLMLLPGDIFDSRLPKQEILAKTFSLLHKPMAVRENKTRIVEMVGKETEIPDIATKGLPIVAIHGTHERRGANSVNAVQVLEKAGFLLHLDCNGVIFDVNGKRVCIQGLSGVPEQDAKKVLEEWAPKAVPGCHNIFMFHQSIKECAYGGTDDAFMSAQDLPDGFDLYIDGHIHLSNVMDTACGKQIFFPGSTVITQQKKKESEKRKGFFMIEFDDTGKMSHEFVELEKQRLFYHYTLEFENAKVQEVIEKAREYISKALSESHDKKPLVRIKLKGTLEKGRTRSDVCADDINKEFDAFVSVKNELEGDGTLKSRIDELRENQQQKLSVEETGLKLIDNLLKETNYKGIPSERILDALANGDTGSVIKEVEKGFDEKTTC